MPVTFLRPGFDKVFLNWANDAVLAGLIGVPVEKHEQPVSQKQLFKMCLVIRVKDQCAPAIGLIRGIAANFAEKYTDGSCLQVRWGRDSQCLGRQREVLVMDFILRCPSGGAFVELAMDACPQGTVRVIASATVSDAEGKPSLESMTLKNTVSNGSIESVYSSHKCRADCSFLISGGTGDWGKNFC